MADVTIGIDLGTTYSLAAHMTKDGPKVLDGLVPSVVTFDANARPIVGEAAREQIADHPRETIFSVKRLMGKAKGELGKALIRHVRKLGGCLTHRDLEARKTTGSTVLTL